MSVSLSYTFGCHLHHKCNLSHFVLSFLPVLMQLVQSMWHPEPKDRPSAAQVVARLETVLQLLPTTPANESSDLLVSK